MYVVRSASHVPGCRGLHDASRTGSLLKGAGEVNEEGGVPRLN